MPELISGSAVDRVLTALDAAGCRTYSRSGQHRAQCPVHKSRGLTLSLRQGNKGAMITCFAGCELTDLAAALGLAMRDLFDGDLPPGYTPPPRRVSTPWDAITQGPGLEHLLHRMVQNAAAEANPAYWDHRAQAFTAARAILGDAPGKRTGAELHAADLAAARRAQACRNHADLIRAEATR